MHTVEGTPVRHHAPPAAAPERSLMITRGHSPRPSRRPRMSWVALPLLAGVLVLAAGASAVGRYADPAGDSGTAPDLRGVTVTRDGTGQILFTIQVADLPAQGEHGIALFVDTDLNGATGAPGTEGADYAIGLDFSEQAWEFARWTGADWDWDTPWSTVRVSSTQQSAIFSVNRSELGNTGGLNFWVRSMRWDNDDADEAPNEGLYNYSLQADGPDIRSVRVSTRPAVGPRAGQAFVLAAPAIQLPPAGPAPAVLARPATVRCTATLAGVRLAGRGAGGCTLAIPRTARGKQLAVVVTVTYQGATKSFRFAYRVR
jgi:hypothetical protein